MSKEILDKSLAIIKNLPNVQFKIKENGEIEWVSEISASDIPSDEKISNWVSEIKSDKENKKSKILEDIDKATTMDDLKVIIKDLIK